MAIAFANLGASANPDINSNADASSYLSASWTPPTSGLILVFVYNTKSTLPEAPSISGNGLTWVLIKTNEITSSRLTLLAADAAGSSAGQTTVDFGGLAQNGCFASFFQATGVDLSGGVAAAFVQSLINGGTGTSGSITLAAAGDSANRPISGWGHRENEVATPQTSWTELDDFGHTLPVSSLETQYRSDAFDTAAAASWAGSVQWRGIAAELKASGVAVPVFVPVGARQPMHMWRDLPRRRLGLIRHQIVFSGEIAAAAQTITGDALLDSTPTLESAGQLPILGDGLLDSTPSLEAAGTLTLSLNGDAILDSTPSLESAGQLPILGNAILDATPSLETAGQLPILGNTILDSTPSIETAGQLPILGNAILDSTPTLEAAGQLPILGNALLDSTPTLESAGQLPILGDALLDSTPSIEAAGQLPILGNTLLDSTPSLEAAGTISIGLELVGDQLLDSVPDLFSAGQLPILGNTLLDSTPTLESAGQLPILGNTLLDSTPSLEIAGNLNLGLRGDQLLDSTPSVELYSAGAFWVSLAGDVILDSTPILESLGTIEVPLRLVGDLVFPSTSDLRTDGTVDIGTKYLVGRKFIQDIIGRPVIVSQGSLSSAILPIITGDRVLYMAADCVPAGLIEADPFFETVPPQGPEGE